jgi:hypothetical protein
LVRPPPPRPLRLVDDVEPLEEPVRLFVALPFARPLVLLLPLLRLPLLRLVLLRLVLPLRLPLFALVPERPDDFVVRPDV